MYNALKTLIGCCGANCETCRVLKDAVCKGCKIGYESGERDIKKAKCGIKRCCIAKNYCTCADCEDYPACSVIRSLHQKNGYKYKKYKEAIEFIRVHGYERFLEVAGKWTMQYGKYDT